MRVLSAIGGLLIISAIGYLAWAKVYSVRGPSRAPSERVVVIGAVIRNLQAIAQAEQEYLARHGAYASLEELQRDGSLGSSPISSASGYTFTATADDGQHFSVTATPIDASKDAMPSLTIDESMQVTRK